MQPQPRSAEAAQSFAASFSGFMKPPIVHSDLARPEYRRSEAAVKSEIRNNGSDFRMGAAGLAALPGNGPVPRISA
jgi:hypothetical protein